MARSTPSTAKVKPESDHAGRVRHVARTALRIVDAEGLAALTMRRLAAEAGMKPMSLYWYFKDKEAVLGAMMPLIDEEIRAEKTDQSADLAGAEWLAELLGRAVRVLTRHHPDITVLVQSSVSSASSQHLTEHALGNFEETLRQLSAVGITGVAAVQTAHLISQSVFMLALVCRRSPDGLTSPDERMRAQWESLRDVSADRYPHIRSAATAFTIDDSTTTLLERGVGLFTAVILSNADRRDPEPA